MSVSMHDSVVTLYLRDVLVIRPVGRVTDGVPRVTE